MLECDAESQRDRRSRNASVGQEEGSCMRVSRYASRIILAGGGMVGGLSDSVVEVEFGQQQTPKPPS